MQAATYQAPRGVFSMPTIKTRLEDRPDLQEVLADVLALREMSRVDHMLTHKSQREILARLNAQDLATVARAISEAERRLQPIYQPNRNPLTQK